VTRKAKEDMMRELAASELDAVGGGQVTVTGNITQTNTFTLTQTTSASATNSGAITATAAGGSATAIGSEALATNTISGVTFTNTIS
jgi:hypothetical protein